MIDKRLLVMVPESRKYILQKVLADWFSLAAGIILWFVVADLLDSALSGGGEPVGRWLLLAALCICMRFILARLAARCSHKASACVKTRLRTEIYGKLRRLGGRYTDAFPTAEIVQLAGEGVEQLESYFGNYLPQLMYAVLAPVTLLIVFWPLSPLTAVVLFICVPLIPAAIVAVQKVAKRLLGQYWDAYTQLGDSFLENLQGLTTLKVYGADEARHQKMNEEAETFRRVTMKVLTMQLNSVTVMDLVAYGGTALGSILGARTFMLGQTTFGGALAMILLASEFFLAMRALGSYFHVAMNGAAASDRMFRLFSLPEDEPGVQEAHGGAVSVHNVSFSYDGSKKNLDMINLDIPQGHLVSLVGESGYGKSTLAALISGERTGYTGRITLGGLDLRDISRESLRRNITVVSASSYLFAGTVRQTLLEGDPQADSGRMNDALEQAGLLEFVREQGGLDMPLAERGSNLSGGQRQRLALARALLRDSPVYIFDEATSNIDAESERQIMQVIYSLRGRHTILLISHRLANVTGSDEIAFLQRGVLAERGTHPALMARNGRYAALYTAQRRLEEPGKEELRCAEAE